MEEQLLTVDEGSSEEGQLSIDSPTSTSVTLEDSAVNRRAAAYQFAGSALDPQLIKDSIANGSEDNIRRNLAVNKALEWEQRKQDILRNFVKVKSTRGEEVTPEEVEFFQMFPQVKPDEDLGTILEREYSKRFITASQAIPDNPHMEQALEEAPEEAHAAMNLASEHITKRQIAQRKYEEVEGAWNKENPLAKVGDFALGLVPFFHWLSTRGNITKLPSSIITGNNLEEQYNYLNHLTPEEFNTRFNEAVDNIYKYSGGGEAFRFIEGYLSWSNDSKTLENLGFGLDVASVIPFGLVGKVVKGVKDAKVVDNVSETLRLAPNSKTTIKGSPTAVQQAKANLGEVIKADKPNPVLSDIAKAVGDSEAAIPLKAAEDVALARKAADEPPGPSAIGRESVRSTLPPVFQDVEGAFSVGTKATQEVVNEVSRSLKDTTALLETALNNTKDVNAVRLTEQAMHTAAKDEWVKIRGTNGKLPISAPSFTPHFEDTNIARVNSIDFHLLSPDGVPFPDEIGANLVAGMWYKLPKGSYEAVPVEGGKYVIKISRNVDETSPAVRDALLLNEKNNEIPNIRGSVLGGLFAKIRTPGETMSPNIMGNANAAQHGVVNLEQSIKSVYKSITKDMSRKELKDLERVLAANMKYHNPVTKTTGAYYNTISDFETEFKNILGYYPSKGQIAGYFKTVRLDEFGQIIKKLNHYRDLARQGAQDITIRYVGEDGKNAVTPKFTGKIVNDVPLETNNPTTILVVNGKDIRYFHTKAIEETDKTYIRKQVKEGGKIIQMGLSHDPVIASMSGVTDTVDFVISKTVNHSPIGLPKFEYSAGGPRIYKQEWAVKQPFIYKSNQGGVYSNIYRGDKTLFLQGTEAEVGRVAIHLNEARKILKDPTKTARDLDAYVRKNLPFTSATFKRWFAENDLSLDHDFFPTRLNQHTIDTPNGRKSFGTATGLRDTTKSPYAFAQRVEQDWAHEAAPRYSSIRGMDPGNPLMKIEPATYVDPIASLQRTLHEAANSRFWSNYQHHAAETWVQQFRHLLTQDEFTVRANPYAALVNAVDEGSYLRVGNGSNEAADIAMAKATRANILNILGRKTKSQEFVDSVKAKILNNVFKMNGQQAAETIDYLISKRFKDPVHTVRSFSFHSRFFFDPSQLLKQGTTLFHTIAMDPKNGFHGFHAGNLFQLARANPGDAKYITHLDGLATKFGWKSGEFTESWNTFLKTGLQHIEGEHLLRDPIETPVVQGAWKNVLDWSLVFFKAPERYTRMVAWNTAYKSWRRANPEATLDNIAINNILRRTSDLTVNMTNAYRNSFSRGLMSIPTQFWSYNTHLFEQIWGKRLTAGEKARVLGMYSFLYGIPTGGSIAFLLPFYQQIKKTGLENGVDMEDDKIKLLTEGVINVGLKAVFGEDTTANTTFGPQGIFTLGNLVKGITTQNKDQVGEALLDMVLGASGNTARDMIDALGNPILSDLNNFIQNGKEFEPLVQDFMEIAGTVRVLSQAEKILMAANFGSWTNKRGETLKGDVNTFQAAFYAFTGLQPQDVEDAYFKIDSEVIRNNLIKNKSKDIIMYFKRGLQADGPENRMAWWRKANAVMDLLDLTPDVRVQFFREAFQNDDSLVKGVNNSFATGRNVPMDQSIARFEQMLKGQ